MNDGPDYRQQQELEEMAQWLEEQDAKRNLRRLEELEQMRDLVDDGQDTPQSWEQLENEQ